MPVPFSEVVQVKPGVLSASGSAVDLNAVVLTQSIYAPQNQVLNFSTAAAVAAYFGASSVEAGIGSGYFQAPDNALATPGLLKFLAYAETAVSGFLLGASLASLTLTELQALSGTLILTVGGVLSTSSSISLSAATSFSDAATIIQTAFTTPPFSVAFDAVHQAFMITTTATGAAATITFCTGTLAAGIGLDSGSAGVLSQGAAVATPATQMNWLIANDQNWASFFTAWSSQQSEQEAFAAWVATVAPRYAYISWDTATADLTPDNSASFGGYLKSLNTAGTLPVYGTELHATLPASWAASLNFGKQNGRVNLCFRTQSGLVPAVTDDTSWQAIKSNGYNSYVEFGSNNPANNSSWFTPGSISGQWSFSDTYFGQIWINANLQLALVNLMKEVGQIPYNPQGDVLIKGACSSPISQFGKFGGFRTGAVLSASQIQQIANLVGTDVSSTISAQGYYLYSNAASTASSVQQQRGSPPIIFIYWDGGSVQSFILPSYVVIG